MQYFTASLKYFQLWESAWKKSLSQILTQRITMNMKTSITTTSLQITEILIEKTLPGRRVITIIQGQARTTTQELINITIRKQVEIIMIQRPMIDATQILINTRTTIITTSITETIIFTAVEIIMMDVATIQAARMISTRKIALAFCSVSSKNWKW